MAYEGAATPGVEGLARLYFELARAGDVERLLELLHPEVEISLKTRGGQTLRGKLEVARFLSEAADARSAVETTAERYRVLDDERVIVEGRIRWMDEKRVLRDDPVVWALEFREGLLFRSLPTRFVGEAEAILAAAPHKGRRDGAT